MVFNMHAAILYISVWLSIFSDWSLFKIWEYVSSMWQWDFQSVETHILDPEF